MIPRYAGSILCRLKCILRIIAIRRLSRLSRLLEDPLVVDDRVEGGGVLGEREVGNGDGGQILQNALDDALGIHVPEVLEQSGQVRAYAPTPYSSLPPLSPTSTITMAQKQQSPEIVQIMDTLLARETRLPHTLVRHLSRDKNHGLEGIQNVPNVPLSQIHQCPDCGGVARNALLLADALDHGGLLRVANQRHVQSLVEGLQLQQVGGVLR